MAGPAFATLPRVEVASLSVANANLDGTGTTVAVIAAGTQGTKVERLVIKAIAVTTAGMIRLFLHDGVNASLFMEIPVSAVAPSASVAAFDDWVDFSTPDRVLVLPPGWSLRASTQKAEAFKVVAIAADYPA